MPAPLMPPPMPGPEVFRRFGIAARAANCVHRERPCEPVAYTLTIDGRAETYKTCWCGERLRVVAPGNATICAYCDLGYLMPKFGG